MIGRKFLIFPVLLLIILAIGSASASDEITLEDVTINHDIVEAPLIEEIESNETPDAEANKITESNEPTHAEDTQANKITESNEATHAEDTQANKTTENNKSASVSEDMQSLTDTTIKTKNINTYYKEKCEWTAYLKDFNNKPISNKKVSVSINGKTYDKITDKTGKIVLKLNLKPGTYTAAVRFAGDENYSKSTAHALIKVRKSTLKIIAKNYKTYFESGFYFKAKVINKFTGNPVENVKVAFKVYDSYKKFKTYHAKTNAKGIAELRKNLKVGSYKVVSKTIKNKYLNGDKSKATLKIKETAEMGCSSIFIQVNKTEAVVAFRRDATNAKNLHIVKYKLNGIPAVKQYKTNSYFFHVICAANGWMAGNGGWDNPTINHKIEKLTGKMFKSGKINKSYLRTIQGYERQLRIGHYTIKAPNGKYAIVWGSGIKTGKLKSGEYIDIPNARSMFRHGNYTQYGKNPAKAAIKIAATDRFGVNRRDATSFHWKATTKKGKTKATVYVRAANDNGRLAGRSTGHLKDNIYFKGKFISKNSLPKTPSSKLLGNYSLGNIDNLIKIKTVVKAQNLTTSINKSESFKITVKNKKTGNPVKGLIIKAEIDGKTYTLKTDKNGVAQLKTNSLSTGTHKVLLYTNNIKYLLRAKNTITIIE